MAATMIRLRRGSQPCSCTPREAYPGIVSSVEMTIGAQLLGLALRGLDAYKGRDKSALVDMVHCYLTNLIADAGIDRSALSAIHHALSSTAGVGVAEQRMEAAVAVAERRKTMTPEEAFRGL